jgi:hypothetical protein
MSTNRNLLKEAIADAKTVKETAIANAKAVLEESFGSQIKSMVSLKLQEMDTDPKKYPDEYVTDQTEDDDEEFTAEEAADLTDFEPVKPVKRTNNEDLEEDLDLNELFKELNENEDEEDDMPEDDMPEDDSEEEGEPIDLEDFTDEDLKDMIEDVLRDMMKSGELELNDEGDMEDKVKDTVEDDIDLEELLREIDGMDNESMESEYELDESIIDMWNKLTMTAGLNALAKGWFKQNKAEILKLKDNPDDAAVDALLSRFEKEMKDKYANSGIFTSDRNEIRKIITGKDSGGKVGSAAGPAGTQYEALNSELEEAYAVINTLRKDLNEVNLLNAKLLYTNKIFKSKNLNENQKVKVLSSFDKATTVKEVKLVFETLNEGLKTKTTKLNENLGSASKVLTAPKKQPIVESNDMVARFQKLAGII